MSMTADEQLKQIAEVEEEIEWLRTWMNLRAQRADAKAHALDRVIAREQAALDELKRGMR
jgi:hypothetical protein